jgi:hypothetical protein
LSASLKSYRDNLPIIDRLAKSDPDNVELQGELAASHANLGDALRKTSQPAEAKEHFATAKEMLARLVAQYPDRTQWKRELTWLDGQIATLDSVEPATAKP